MELSKIQKYPSFYEVCRYVSQKEFELQRVESAQWVHYDYNVLKILEGNYNEVLPLHIELAPTFLCNFACPWCNYTSTQKSYLKDRSKLNLSSSEIKWKILKELICQFSTLNIGIQWTGGEPLCAKNLIDGVEFGSKLKIKQCLFSNGSLLDEDKANKLLRSNLFFIRISLNCVTPRIHSKFHGLKEEYFSNKVIQNFKNLLRIKITLKSKVEIGVSIILNDVNNNDLTDTLKFLFDCSQEFKNSLNFIVIRSVFNFKKLKTNGNSNLSSPGCHEVNAIINRLKKNNVKVIEIKPYDFKNELHFLKLGCLSSNWFGEIKPNGALLICSDVYGNEDYRIGDIKSDKILTIYKSKQRDTIIKKTINSICFPNQCPQNGRGYMLNNIFYQIEHKRRLGRINEVSNWINHIKQLTPKPIHSFFI